MLTADIVTVQWRTQKAYIFIDFAQCLYAGTCSIGWSYVCWARRFNQHSVWVVYWIVWADGAKSFSIEEENSGGLGHKSGARTSEAQVVTRRDEERVRGEVKSKITLVSRSWYSSWTFKKHGGLA